MFKPSPFKDAEKNPEPPERGILDFFGLCFAFIWFYRKIWIGIILLCGVAFLINYLTSQDKNKDIGESKPGPGISTTLAQSDLPKVKIGKIESSELDSDTESEIGETIEKKKSSLAKLLSTGSISELIEESLYVRDNWGTQPPAIAFMLNRERMDVSQRLMELDLSESQRTFATVSYIESISILDSLNIRHKFKASGIGTALAEMDNNLTKHPDQKISAKAHLAITISPANKYFYTGELSFLRQFEAELTNRINNIIVEPSSLERLCQIMLSMKNKTGFEDETNRTAMALYSKMEQANDPRVKNMAKRYKEQLLFDHLGLDTFTNRITIDDNLSRAQVQELFQSLASNPDSSSKVFQVAVDSIKTYHAMKKYDDAIDLANWLNKISDTIPVEKNKQVMKEAMTQLESQISVRN